MALANIYDYRRSVKEHERYLCELQRVWEFISESPNTPEHGKCAIRSVLEQTDKLLTGKFDYMSTLLDDPEEQKELDVTITDLENLYNALCIELEDVSNKYIILYNNLGHNWPKPTGLKNETPSKQHENTAATLERSVLKDTPLGNPKGSFTMSVPTATPSTSSSEEMDSTSVRKNPFRGLFESPTRIYSETDDSEDEFYDALSS